MEVITFEYNKEIPSCKTCKHNKCYDICDMKGNKVMENVHICLQSPFVKDGALNFDMITNQDIVCSNFERGIE